MKKYIILIPIYNDRESLTKLIENINSEVKSLNSEISVIIINDASSQQIIDKYQNTENINSIEIIQALPIESETRKLPKTGYYKGTPFAGSWQERTSLVNLMNEMIVSMCDRNGWSTWKHSDAYKNTLGELSFDVMEKPKSVHLAREFYRWDLINNEPNKKLEVATIQTALF